MVKVECDGCKSTYELEERRIPAAGLKMRCAKCGKSLVVTKDGAGPGIPMSAASLKAPLKTRPKPAPRAHDMTMKGGFSPDDEARGFGAVDLPAVAPRGGEGAGGAAGAASPAVKSPPLEESFGDLDLLGDLPSVPAASPPAKLEVTELPSAKRAPAADRKFMPPMPQGARPGQAAKPSDRGATTPAPAPSFDLEDAAFAADLPSPAPVRARGFGDIDLPMPAIAGLPAPARADLPSPAKADLPSPTTADLPSPADTGGEQRFTGREPTGRRTAPVRKETFGKLDLSGLPPLEDPPPPPPPAAPKIERREEPPAARPQIEKRDQPRAPAAPEPWLGSATLIDPPKVADLGFDKTPPAQAMNPHASADAASEPSGEADPFDFPLDEASLPLPEQVPKGFDFGLDPGPPPAKPAAPPATGPFSGGLGAGLDLDLSSGGPGAHSPPGGAPGAVAPAPPGGDMLGLSGGPLGGLDAGSPGVSDSSSDPAAGTDEKPKGEPAKAAAADGQRPSKRSMAKYAALASILVIGGASLTLLPDIGPFGWNFISDQINAKSHLEAYNDLRKKAQEELDLDTTTSSAQAFARARATQAQMPRHRATAAYTAYVAFARTLRFGKKGGEDAIGKQLLALAADEPGDALDLANASLALTEGKLDRARTTISYLTRHAPNDIDAAALAGELELAAKDKEKALAAWDRAVALDKKSARALYGKARAAVLAGDLAVAEESARAALAASPKHTSVIVLLASVVWQRSEKDEEPVELLGKVTGTGELKASAGERDVIEASTLLGEIHLARSRITAADEAFAAALKIDPQAMRPLLGSGELYYRSGRFADATARFEAATRADAANVDAQIGMAKTVMAQERSKEAKDILVKTRAANPKSGKVAYWIGRAEDTLGNKKDAEAAYLEAISLGGTTGEVIDAYVALAYLLSSQGRAEDAAAKLAEASGKYPDLPALHRAKGDVALQTGRYDEAKSEFELALARGEDLGTRFKLASAQRRMRAFDEAAATLDKIEAADKEFPGLSLERGLLFEETGRSDKALEMYAAALQKAPNDVDLKLRVGSAQVAVGQVKQAEVILKEVLKARPQSAEANHFLGRALLFKGVNLTEAMRFLERAVEIDPNRAEYQVFVAWAANESNQATRAEAAITRALALDKELADAYWQRGILLQKQGASMDALKDLETALAKRPSRFEAYATMALCYQDLGRWPDAEAAFQKAIAGNDSVPEWHYRLGKVYMTRGNRAGASAEMEKAISLAAVSIRPSPAWLFDAHFLVAEFLRATGNGAKAIEHYNAFLATAPADNAYRADAEKALKALGARR